MQSMPIGAIACMFAIVVLGCVIATFSKKGRPRASIFISFAVMAIIVCLYILLFIIMGIPYLQYVFAILIIAIPLLVFAILEKRASKESHGDSALPASSQAHEASSTEEQMPIAQTASAEEQWEDPIRAQGDPHSQNAELPIKGTQTKAMPVKAAQEGIASPSASAATAVTPDSSPQSSPSRAKNHDNFAHMEKPTWRMAKSAPQEKAPSKIKSLNAVAHPNAPSPAKPAPSPRADSPRPYGSMVPQANNGFSSNARQMPAQRRNPYIPPARSSSRMYIPAAATSAAVSRYSAFRAEDADIEEVSESIIKATEDKRKQFIVTDYFDIEEPDFRMEKADASRSASFTLPEDYQLEEPLDEGWGFSRTIANSTPTFETSDAHIEEIDEPLLEDSGHEGSPACEEAPVDASPSSQTDSFGVNCEIPLASHSPSADVQTSSCSSDEPVQSACQDAQHDESSSCAAASIDDTHTDLTPQENHASRPVENVLDQEHRSEPEPCSPTTPHDFDEGVQISQDASASAEQALPQVIELDAANASNEQDANVNANEHIAETEPDDEALSIASETNESRTQAPTEYMCDSDGIADKEEPETPTVVQIDVLIRKADAFKAKGMHDIAARLYREASTYAEQSSVSRSLRFSELSCYIKSGNKEMVKELTNELKRSPVLTKAERMKLQAAERIR